MPEFDRLTEFTDWIELAFVEREATPESLMKVGIHLHAVRLSLLDIDSVVEEPKRRTNQFANRFRHATRRTAEDGLQMPAFAWNQPI